MDAVQCTVYIEGGIYEQTMSYKIAPVAVRPINEKYIWPLHDGFEKNYFKAIRAPSVTRSPD
jgi:hypothetical protein